MVLYHSHSRINCPQLIVAEFLDNPAPTPLERFPLKSSTAFTPSSFDGSPQYNYSSPSGVDTIDILFASPPWNSQVHVG